MKITRLLPLMTLAPVLAIAACQQAKQPADQASPDAKPNLSVSDATLVLPAVKGNPGAAYFTLTNAGHRPVTLAGVHIQGAGKTEMHETKGGEMRPMNWVQLEAGKTVTFERGGKHVMAFDLIDGLEAGGTTEMTLTFSGGDKLSTPLAIQSPGGATSGMEAMH